MGEGGAVGMAGMGAMMASGPVGWIGAAAQLIGAFKTTDQSQASGADQANLNTSGWVVGDGDAQGGSMSASAGGLNALPWWVWAAGTLLAVAIVKRTA